MTDPTIATAGTTNQLLLITDQDRIAYRIPKMSLSNIVNSSNENSFRIDINTSSNSVILIFDSAAKVTAFIAMIDTLY